MAQMGVHSPDDPCANLVDPVLSKWFPPPGVVEDWTEWLRVEDESDVVNQIRRQTSTAAACAPPNETENQT